MFGGGILAAGLGFGAIAYGHEVTTGPPRGPSIQGELIDTGCFVTSDGNAKGKDHAA